MKSFFFTSVCAMVMASVCWPAPALKERKDDDGKRILGVWRQEAISVRGAANDATGVNTFRFRADGTCGIINDNVMGAQERGALYTLDLTATPKRMKWLNGPERTEWLCLVEFNGDNLKFAFVDQGSEPPKVIEPTGNLTIYYLKRVKE